MNRWCSLSDGRYPCIRQISGRTQSALANNSSQAKKANLTLNEEECEFSKPSVEFLGTLIHSEGLHVSPKKVEAILKMKTPQDQTELRRFLGMVNQLSRFQPKMAELSKPFRDLLSSKSHWLWSDVQQQAFAARKENGA